MEKEEKLPAELENPFKGFSIVKGEFRTDEDYSKDKDSEKDDKISDESEEDSTIEDKEKEALKKGDKALEKVIEKTIKIKEAKEKELQKETLEDEEDSEDSDEEDDSKNSNEGEDIRNFVKALSEKGIIDYDDTDEDFKNDEDSIDILINKTVNNRINKWFNNKPEEFTSLLQFVENGGSPKQFMDVYYGNHSWEDFKIDHEDNQKLVIKESLRLSGESEDDIQDMIDEWEVNGSLEKRAKPALTKLQKNENMQKAELLKQQEAYANQQRKAQEEYWENFKNNIQKKDELKGFKLTPKVKDNLWEFLTVTDKKTGKTGYEKAIEEDTDSSLLFAYLAMNKFDIAKLEKQVETKVSKKYTGMLKNYSTSTKEKISTGKSIDYTDDDPFKGFRSK